jgi:uncharacterized protein
MRLMPKQTKFEWDDGNISKNLEKHNVTVTESEEIFLSSPFLVVEDHGHSSKSEQRFHGMGKTKSGRMLLTVFTIRADKVRVISIRDMHRNERKIYENFKNNS